MRLITSLRSKVAASVVAATIAGAVIMFLGSGSAALHLMVRSYDGGAGAIDAGPNAVSQVVVEEWSNRLTDGVMMSWVGLVNVPDDGPARFAVASAGTVEIRVDGRLVLRRSESGVVTLVEASTSVPPGVHLVSIVFRHIAGPTNLVLRWRLGENDQLADIPTTAFSPTRLGAWQWSARLLIPAALFAVNLAWLVLVTTALVAIGRRLWSIPTWSTQDRYVLGLSLVLFVCGVWWGWPGTGWAVDELSPDMIRDAVKARFANGWHDKYPPSPTTSLQSPTCLPWPQSSCSVLDRPTTTWKPCCNCKVDSSACWPAWGLL